MKPLRDKINSAGFNMFNNPLLIPLPEKILNLVGNKYRASANIGRSVLKWVVENQILRSNPNAISAAK